MSLNLPEIERETSARARIMKIMALVGCVLSPNLAAADESMTSIHLQACETYGKGYIESDGESVELRLPRHLLTNLLERKGACGHVQIGAAEVPLNSFASLSEGRCEADLELPENVEDNDANDPHCGVPLSSDVVEASGAMVLEDPGQVAPFTPGSYLAMHDLDSPGLVVFQVQENIGQLVTLEPIQGEVRRGDSGSALLPAFRSEAGEFEIQNFTAVATMNGFYAPIGHTVPEGLSSGFEPLSNNWYDSVGVLGVRRGR